MQASVAPDYVQLLQQSGWLRDVDGQMGSLGRKVHELGGVKGFKSSAVANGQVRITANVQAPGDPKVYGVLVFLSLGYRVRKSLSAVIACRVVVASFSWADGTRNQSQGRSL